MTRFAVVGAMNLDIVGSPISTFRLRDSNIGRVTFRPGGVGRNIAEYLARMGGMVSLLTVIGQDHNAGILEHSCQTLGISLSDVLRVSGNTPVYLCIHDENRDMIAAVNDMEIMMGLTPEYMEKVLPVINSACVCVLDANVPEPALNYIAAHARVPIVVDPVSCIKSSRIRKMLPCVCAFKPNISEASYLSGMEKPEDAAGWFLTQGVQRVFISLGAKGVYFADRNSRGYETTVPVARSIQTGAGDAMCAGIAFALAAGADTPTCAKAGCRAAAEHLDRILQEGIV